MVSLTPRYWRSQPASAIHSGAGDGAGHADEHGAGDVAGQRQALGQRRAGQAAQHQRPFAADDHQAGARGNAPRTAPSASAAPRAASVFCQENQSPNAPLNSSSQTSTGLTPANADEDAEQQQRRRDGRGRQQGIGSRSVSSACGSTAPWRPTSDGQPIRACRPRLRPGSSSSRARGRSA